MQAGLSLRVLHIVSLKDETAGSQRRQSQAMIDVHILNQCQSDVGNRQMEED